MRHGVRVCCFVALAAGVGVLYAETPPRDDESDIRPGCIHRPQDTAPAELVIVPRPAEEYLPKGSLLATGARGPRQVDLDELRRRKIAMYAGRPATDSLAAAPGAARAVSAAPVALPAASSVGADFGALVFWAMIAGCVAATLWLLLRVLAALRRREPRAR